MTTEPLPETLRRALHESGGRPRGEGNDLMRDALVMSVNKNLLDVTTLLQWAHEAQNVDDKLGHVRQAGHIMRDLEGQLEDLARVRRRSPG